MGTLKAIDTDTAAKAEDFLVNLGPLGASYGNTTTLLPNGKVLIAGGFLQTTIPTTKNYVFSRAELFDPATGKWTETGSMNVTRDGHTATLLHNGKVLVAGGENLRDDGRLNHLSSAELYDPTTGKWMETGSMSTASTGSEAVLQPNDKVRIPGYYEGDQKRPGDNLYDPATGTWTVITNK
jgi:N-acetylneuraminic acid mutarotase